MDMRGFAGQGYFSAESEGLPITAKIVAVKVERMKDGRSKPVVTIDQPGPQLVLNKGNAQALIDAFGPDSEAWVGRTITISLHVVQFMGKKTKGILVKPDLTSEKDIPF